MGGGSGQTTAGAHTMPNFIKTAAVAVAAALACAVAGAADFSAQTIRLAHTAAVSHAHHEAALQFAKNVSERTGGKVKVEVYPAGELGDQPALAEQVTLGALDSAVVSLGNLAMYSKKLNAMTAPFLFKDYDHAHRTIDAFVMPWMNPADVNSTPDWVNDTVCTRSSRTGSATGHLRKTARISKNGARGLSPTQRGSAETWKGSERSFPIYMTWGYRVFT